ncbi:LysE family translocator [Mycolicibacterium hodleri]
MSRFKRGTIPTSVDLMEWTTYGAFMLFVSVIILIPGPDVAVAVKNALVGGRRQGVAAVVGIGIASLMQSTAAVTGLSVLITTAEPVFLTVKWVGAAYLCFLAAQAWRSAWRGRYPDVVTNEEVRPAVAVGLRQGFLCNITNPKILAFNLAVFPQFLGTHPTPLTATVYAVSLPALGSLYLLVLVVGVDRARVVFSKISVRRAMDTITGATLLGFGARLATE